MRNNKYIIVLLIAVSVMCALVLPGHKDVYEKGVPDLVSSRSFANSNHYEEDLIIVANADNIEDPEKFARNIVQMCIDNSFHSIKFSVDIYGYPNRITARIYHWREDIGNHDSVFAIKYEPEDDMNYESTIADDTTDYKLYIDDQLIEL